MILNDQALKKLVREAVAEALAQQDNQVYYGYTDVKSFIEISGISKPHMEDKVIPHPNFKHCVFRFDESTKRYTHIQKGLAALDEILVKGRDANV